MNRLVVASSILLVVALPVRGQQTPLNTNAKFGGSANVHMLGHVSLGGFFHSGGLDIEADPARPFVYVKRIFDQPGINIVSISDPRKTKVIYYYRLPHPDHHTTIGVESRKH